MGWRRLLVVDRVATCLAARERLEAAGATLVCSEWDEFLDTQFADPDPADQVVPSPLMPHLMVHWLLRRAVSRCPGRPAGLEPIDIASGLPYDAAGPDGTRYLSFADWRCPIHCIEPATCPRTRAPRTWEMGDALADLARRLAAAAPGVPVLGPACFTCRHRTHGVGTFGGDDFLRADAMLADAAARPVARLLVGTVSACHGAASLLRLG